MNEKIDAIVLKGPYKRDQLYSYGDLVEYDGNSYLALKSGILPAPTNPGDSWYKLNSRATFYRTSVAPKFTEDGDKWFDTSTGILYTRVKQTNGVLMWIEL